MRDEYWHAFFWVFVVASWTFGFAYGRWAGGGKLGSLPVYSESSSWIVPDNILENIQMPSGVEVAGYTVSGASVQDVLNWYKGQMTGWTLENGEVPTSICGATSDGLIYMKDNNVAVIVAMSGTELPGTCYILVTGPESAFGGGDGGAGGGGFFSELGKAVSVPLGFSSWWQPLAYFTLTILAMFVLAQLFFGVGAAIFLFARGVSDSAVILALEKIVQLFPNIQPQDAWMLVIGMLIIVVNLPLCIWSAHMGTQRTVYMWRRLRGQPMKPETTTKPIFNFLIVMAISIVTGIVAAVAFSYA